MSLKSCFLFVCLLLPFGIMAKKPITKKEPRILRITPVGWQETSVTPIGFFAYLKSIIFCLHFYEQMKESKNYVGAEIILNKGPYFCPVMGPNWWEYYFEPLSKPDGDFRHVRKPFQRMIDFTWNKNFSRKQAYETIRKYIRIKPHIQKKVDSFVDSNFNNHFIIGIHYRGTDKIIEVPRIAYEALDQEINEVIIRLNNQNYKIFVATDEHKLIEYITTKYNNVIYTDCFRSTNGSPVHYSRPGDETPIQDPALSSLQPYMRGEEALIDCLLLSRCNILIRTISHFSSCAGAFNPFIPMITIGKGYTTVADENTRYCDT